MNASPTASSKAGTQGAAAEAILSNPGQPLSGQPPPHSLPPPRTLRSAPSRTLRSAHPGLSPRECQSVIGAVTVLVVTGTGTVSHWESFMSPTAQSVVSSKGSQSSAASALSHQQQAHSVVSSKRSQSSAARAVSHQQQAQSAISSKRNQ